MLCRSPVTGCARSTRRIRSKRRILVIIVTRVAWAQAVEMRIEEIRIPHPSQIPSCEFFLIRPVSVPQPTFDRGRLCRPHRLRCAPLRIGPVSSSVPFPFCIPSLRFLCPPAPPPTPRLRRRPRPVVSPSPPSPPPLPFRLRSSWTTSCHASCRTCPHIDEAFRKGKHIALYPLTPPYPVFPSLLLGRLPIPVQCFLPFLQEPAIR